MPFCTKCGLPIPGPDKEHDDCNVYSPTAPATVARTASEEVGALIYHLEPVLGRVIFNSIMKAFFAIFAIFAALSLIYFICTSK